MNDISLPQRETPDSLMLYGFWYRALPSEQVRGTSYARPCCSKLRWSSGAIARAGRSLFTTPVRIAACRSPAVGSTANRWNAVITAGGLMRQPASAS